ncbi:MAG TPA: glycoside hydrolase family 88 protein [Rariglobus sp.]|nr:glycoside hydrolase family 88 protein [Rariglobus sp.]
MSALRAPFGWPVIRIVPGQPFTLRLPAPAKPAPQGGWLRITVSTDDREEKLLSVSLPSTSREVGIIDLRYAHSLEPFQLSLSADDYTAAAREGVVLTLTQVTCPLQLLAHDLPSDAAPLAPQLIPDLATDRLAAFFDRLASRASVQTFGWMEGCVLDALHDLHAATGESRWRAALDAHLALFITPDHRLVYENARGHPADGTLRSIEGTLPFAQITKIAPAHPLLALALEFFRSKFNADGTFTHPESITAEGSYTVAYPLAVLAQIRSDRSLAQLSANVLRVRRESLRRPDGLWLRHHPDDTRTFRSWARGVAWYLLGFGRSLEHLEGLTDTTDLKTEFLAAATWALGYQRADGLWGCFLDDDSTLQDTSGSAGIATAFARGAKAGLLPAEIFIPAATRCWKALPVHLTPDGFLGGAAQSNRGGEPLQRGPYRVLAPMGMGLMGQLAAALNVSPDIR